jgi:hypothetical protein
MKGCVGTLGIAGLAAAFPLAFPVSASAAPDLQAKIESVSPQPAVAGSVVVAKTQLTNTGPHAANLDQRQKGRPVPMLRWVFKEGGGADRFLLETTFTELLPAGGVKSIPAVLKIPPDARPGSHMICVIADPKNKIAESNEGNNRGCTRIWLKPGAAGPDLKVSIASVSPQPAAAGSVVVANTQLTNAGSQTADLGLRENGRAIPMLRWVFKEGGGGPDRFLLETAILEALPAGGVKNLPAVLQLPASAKPGTHTICAVADPENKMSETNERNNRGCVRIKLVQGSSSKMPVMPSKPGKRTGQR